MNTIYCKPTGNSVDFVFLTHSNVSLMELLAVGGGHVEARLRHEPLSPSSVWAFVFRIGGNSMDKPLP